MVAIRLRGTGIAVRFAVTSEGQKPMAELSARIRHALNRHGIYNLDPETVAAVSYPDLYRQHDFGKKSMNELRAWLGERGFDLTDAPPKRRVVTDPPSSDELEAITFLKQRGYSVQRTRRGS